MTNPVRATALTLEFVQLRAIILHAPLSAAFNAAAPCHLCVITQCGALYGHSAFSTFRATRAGVVDFCRDLFKASHPTGHSRQFLEPAEQLPDLDEGKLHRHQQPLDHCDTVVIKTTANGHAFALVSSGGAA